MKPYYDDGMVTIYHGDCLAMDQWLAGDVLLTDPPFGIDYRSGAPRSDGNARSIANDKDTAVRDAALALWHGPALVFGSWKVDPPAAERTRLVWDQDGALGMGDLSLPWKPSWQFIHVIGGPWTGKRDCGSVLRCPPVQSLGRKHPHEKPIQLLGQLLNKCVDGTVVDPFMGSGSTLEAARLHGRMAIGVELNEGYCEIAARRLEQGVLDFGDAA